MHVAQMNTKASGIQNASQTTAKDNLLLHTCADSEVKPCNEFKHRQTLCG